MCNYMYFHKSGKLVKPTSQSASKSGQANFKLKSDALKEARDSIAAGTGTGKKVGLVEQSAALGEEGMPYVNGLLCVRDCFRWTKRDNDHATRRPPPPPRFSGKSDNLA